MMPSYIDDLCRQINRTLKKRELKQIATHLGIDWGNWKDNTQEEAIQGIVGYLVRRKKVGLLVELLREKKPKEIWNDPPL